MRYKIDKINKKGTKLYIGGWVKGKSPSANIEYKLLDYNKINLELDIKKTQRPDVNKIFFTDYEKVTELGFDFEFLYDETKTYYFVIKVDKEVKVIKLNKNTLERINNKTLKRLERLKDSIRFKSLKKGVNYLKKEGFKAFLKKVYYKFKNLDDKYYYVNWYNRVKPTYLELDKQKKIKFEKQIKFSIVVPIFETPDIFLKEFIDSVLAQTYQNFELCFADGSRVGKDKKDIVEKYINRDLRIKYKLIGENLGISGNTNVALDMVSGDFIVFCDHDDVLVENALFECAKAINFDNNIDCLYSDEDKLDMYTGELHDPHFKPDFNIDLLRSVNYISHLFVAKKGLIEECGKFESIYDGAQDYDFIFRIVEKAKKVYHIPKVLYHWRCHMDSTAINPESKLYAFEAGKRAIKAHLDRSFSNTSVKIKDVLDGVDYGIYHVKYGNNNELISVIIPNKDHIEDLDKAIRSLYLKGSYKNLEFIIVENNSVDEKTFAYYKDIQKEFFNVKVVYFKGTFNYSAINNYGVSFANGEYLLFLNNDIELINEDSIEEMLGLIRREDVGVVGARLLYPDDSIQHAGVVVGFGGIAGHTFIGLQKEERSYFNRAMIMQDYSAVTAACMLSKKSIFEAVNGFSEELAVAFNDIDYCMKVRALDKLIVYNPQALFYHYESKSRGLEDTKEKIERFNREIATFMKKWPEILEKGDPFYNPNLTLKKSNFELKDLETEKIGEKYRIKGIEAYL